jgi:hypothetical protein
VAVKAPVAPRAVGGPVAVAVAAVAVAAVEVASDAAVVP